MRVSYHVIVTIISCSQFPVQLGIVFDTAIEQFDHGNMASAAMFVGGLQSSESPDFLTENAQCFPTQLWYVDQAR